MQGTPFATPSNNAFGGGARFGISPPTAGSGTLAPASTDVPNPAAGVSAGNLSYARNNSGSNIRIPYHRLVPLSETGTALPANSVTNDGGATTREERCNQSIMPLPVASILTTHSFTPPR